MIDQQLFDEVVEVARAVTGDPRLEPKDMRRYPGLQAAVVQAYATLVVAKRPPKEERWADPAVRATREAWKRRQALEAECEEEEETERAEIEAEALQEAYRTELVPPEQAPTPHEQPEAVEGPPVIIVPNGDEEEEDGEGDLRQEHSADGEDTGDSAGQPEVPA